MKTIFNTNQIVYCILLLFFFSSENSYSQLAVPFKVRYQSYVKGDMTVISNNIVNRKESRTFTSEPYNDISETAKLNDQFEMNYIDVDDDKSTFSSSSAGLNLENSSSKKIKYAGLYWSATYKYDSGIRDKKWNYVAVDDNRSSVNEIKLKLPGQNEYIDIYGDIIFDGLNIKNFKESAPYAVYADVTKHIQSLQNPNGEYTVANIRATQGIISGGVAGGWTLFLVYEDETETGKFITSFDGFVGITARPVEILYSGFSTLPEGKVNAKLAGSVLEGDRNLVGDQLEIKSGESKNYTLLSHSLKPVDNFFNSTIVINDSYFENRKPNSMNTLGFDTFLIPIENENNAVIQNNSTKVSLKLKSSGDRYSMFFSAFNVEVQDPTEKIESELISSNVTTKNSDIVMSDAVKVISSEKPNNSTSAKEENKPQSNQYKSNTELTATEIKAEMEKLLVDESVKKIETKFYSIRDMIKESEKLNAEIDETKSKKRITVLPGADVLIPNQPKGYYVVANVFAKPNNAERFEAKLKKKGLDAQILYNPTTNLKSVYIGKFGTWSDAVKFYYSNAEGKYTDELWIMLVNTSTGTIL
ncbi:SPOR domain-containing protein [Flavobacterium azooxidireducens]|uniref:SPOR domain-containing protein n=1 Tax=Flavobacterium azooxidireducens TaxID=1871076 RepID=A0ABY4KDJ5_9FLAO|nr:SPOR domain-containing protein [Flavobacterium azooxidireducens]UPQ78386.1 SPOR domain-containing protein [Flavobacterium azooxidireducens]